MKAESYVCVCMCALYVRV